MRCLLIAPASMDVHLLSGVLVDQGLEVIPSSELGAGVTLAEATIDADCAVAVLPSKQARTPETLAAIFIEIGIAAGRGLPILVIVEPPEAPPLALTGATIVRASVDHVEALRLHLRMFMLSAASGDTKRQPKTIVALEPSKLADFRARLDAIRNAPKDHVKPGGGVAAPQGMRLQRLIYEILLSSGAVITTNVLLSDPFIELDAVAYVQGTESVLGAIVIELKLRRITEDDLLRVRYQLRRNMAAAHASFGLLLHDSATPGAQIIGAAPFMLALSIDALLAELEHTSLGELLLRARNRAVHGASA